MIIAQWYTEAICVQLGNDASFRSALHLEYGRAEGLVKGEEESSTLLWTMLHRPVKPSWRNSQGLKTGYIWGEPHSIFPSFSRVVSCSLNCPNLISFFHVTEAPHFDRLSLQVFFFCSSSPLPEAVRFDCQLLLPCVSKESKHSYLPTFQTLALARSPLEAEWFQNMQAFVNVSWLNPWPVSNFIIQRAKPEETIASQLLIVLLNKPGGQKGSGDILITSPNLCKLPSFLFFSFLFFLIRTRMMYRKTRMTALQIKTGHWDRD